MAGTEIVTAEGCVHCENAKKYLNEKGISYTEKPFDKMTDTELGNLVDRLGQDFGNRVGFPIICNTKTNKCVIGNDPAGIDEVVKG